MWIDYGAARRLNDMRIPVISRIAGLPLRTRWIVISVIVLCGVELVLAFALSASWVKDVPWLLAFADKIKPFAPVVGNFDQVARYPEGMRVFLAISICLFLLKIFLFYMYAYVTYDPQEEAKMKLSFWMTLLIVVMGVIFLWYALTFKVNTGPISRGYLMKSGGISLWLSWSIFQLGITSWFVSGMLFILWKKCVSVFHNLKGRKNG